MRREQVSSRSESPGRFENATVASICTSALIAIARAGTGQLVGEVTIGQSRGVSWQDLEAAVDLNHIQDPFVLRYTKPHAWVLQDVPAYVEPRPYRHPTGCVNWILLRQSGAQIGACRTQSRRGKQTCSYRCSGGRVRCSGLSHGFSLASRWHVFAPIPAYGRRLHQPLVLWNWRSLAEARRRWPLEPCLETGNHWELC